MKKSRKLVRDLSIFFFVLFCLSSAGTAFWFFTKWYNNVKEEKNVKRVTIDNHKYLKAKINNSVDILLANDSIQQSKFYLSEKGLNKLARKFENEVNFGPEIFQLKYIRIGKSGFFDNDNTRGSYSPLTFSIDLNTNTYIDFFNVVTKEEKNDREESAKIELLFQTLMHEYYHHVFNSYFKNLKSNSQYSNEIYLNSIDEETNKITSSPYILNKHFFNEFKNILGYNKTNNQFNIQKRTDNKGINSFYSPKDFFEYSNFKPSKSNQIDMSIIKNVHFISNSKKISSNFSRKFSDLKEIIYLYSIDELFSRKYSQLSYLWKINNSINNSNLSFLLPNGTINLNRKDENGNSTFDNVSSRTLFLSDIQMYMDEMNSYNNINEYHMSDYVFSINPSTEEIENRTTRSEKLYDLWKDFQGNKKGSDISIMFPYNSFFNFKSYSSITSFNKGNEDLVRFGGFVSKSEIENIFDETAKGSTFKEKIKTFKANLTIDNNGKYEKLKNIKFYEYNANRKKNLLDKGFYNNPLDSDEKFFWIIDNGDGNNYNYINNHFDIDDFIDGKKIIDKKMFLTSNKENANISIKSFREKEQGIVSNIYNNNSVTNILDITNPYLFEKNNIGDVVLKKG